MNPRDPKSKPPERPIDLPSDVKPTSPGFDENPASKRKEPQEQEDSQKKR
jgi:hypothetical protein